MTPIVEQIATTLMHQTDARAVHDALLNAACLFEKAIGAPPCAWPAEVVNAELNEQDFRRLQNSVAAYVERTGSDTGTWALGKCFDPTLKPLFIAMLRRHLDGDAGALYQAMISLDNLREPVFGNVRSRSILNESINRQLAREYLNRL